MSAFDLCELPPFLEIRLKGTGQAWTNASPRLTMIGSKLWLSYGIGAMDCILQERIEDNLELTRAVLSWKRKLRGKSFFEVDSVFIDGKLREAYRDGDYPHPLPIHL